MTVTSTYFFNFGLPGRFAGFDRQGTLARMHGEQGREGVHYSQVCALASGS